MFTGWQRNGCEVPREQRQTSLPPRETPAAGAPAAIAASLGAAGGGRRRCAVRSAHVDGAIGGDPGSRRGPRGGDGLPRIACRPRGAAPRPRLVARRRRGLAVGLRRAGPPRAAGHGGHRDLPRGGARIGGGGARVARGRRGRSVGRCGPSTGRSRADRIPATVGWRFRWPEGWRRRAAGTCCWWSR
jgi:hypothetical protein